MNSVFPVEGQTCKVAAWSSKLLPAQAWAFLAANIRRLTLAFGSCKLHGSRHAIRPEESEYGAVWRRPFFCELHDKFRTHCGSPGEPDGTKDWDWLIQRKSPYLRGSLAKGLAFTGPRFRNCLPDPFPGWLGARPQKKPPISVRSVAENLSEFAIGTY